MSDDVTYISLHCYGCGKYNCSICPIGTYVPEDSLRGCVRQISEDDFARYHHLADEELPFAKDKEEVLNRISELERKICSAPLSHILDAKGKILSSKKMDKLIEEYNESIRK